MGMLLRRHYKTLDELEADAAEEETSLTPVTEDEPPEETEPEEAEPEPEEVSDGDAGTRKGKA